MSVKRLRGNRRKAHGKKYIDIGVPSRLQSDERVGERCRRSSCTRRTRRRGAANMVGDMAARRDWPTAGHVWGVPSSAMPVFFPPARRRANIGPATVWTAATPRRQCAQNVPYECACLFRAGRKNVSFSALVLVLTDSPSGHESNNAPVRFLIFFFFLINLSRNVFRIHSFSSACSVVSQNTAYGRPAAFYRSYTHVNPHRTACRACVPNSLRVRFPWSVVDRFLELTIGVCPRPTARAQLPNKSYWMR